MYYSSPDAVKTSNYPLAEMRVENHSLTHNLCSILTPTDVMTLPNERRLIPPEL